MNTSRIDFSVGATPRAVAGMDVTGMGEAAGRAPAPSRAARIARLSAGVVPGGVSFEPAHADPAGALAMHAAPADRNTAATGVALGRVIDVTA
jgi:hypothetical protein